jgi:shikimate dehydrogenase
MTRRPALSAATAVAGVIGHPVRHSLSPAIHNAAFRETALDWVYVAFDVAPGEADRAVAAMRALGVRGLSVTMPHKEQVCHHVDVLDDAARALRSVNCLTLLDDGRVHGSSTDGEGLVASLGADHGVDVTGRSVMVVGAGGAARSLVDALARARAAEVLVVNRTGPRAVETAALAPGVARVGTLAELPTVDVVVNATSVGMGSDDLAFDVSGVHAGQVVVDLVYHPLDTALLRAAQQQGARTVDGLGMLVHQAARQFQRWTGQAAPVAAMRAAALAQLGARAAR